MNRLFRVSFHFSLLKCISHQLSMSLLYVAICNEEAVRIDFNIKALALRPMLDFGLIFLSIFTPHIGW